MRKFSAVKILIKKKIHTLSLRKTTDLNMDGYIIPSVHLNSKINSPAKSTPVIADSPVKDPTMSASRPFRVSVEGNIGAGKSTLLKYFSEFPEVETYSEPLDWWRNLDGHNLLELLYTDISRWHSTFQMYVQLTRLKIQTTPPKRSSTTVQMFERSVQNNRYCFVEQAKKSGILHGANYAIIDEWFKWAKRNCDINLDLIVYLRSTPEVVYERMKARNRPEEEGVQLQYLKELHESHEEWLSSGNPALNAVPVLVLDADKTMEEIVEQYRANENKILNKNREVINPTDESNRDDVKKVLDFNS